MVKIVDGQIVNEEESARGGRTSGSSISGLPDSLTQSVQLFGVHVPVWGLGAGAILAFLLFGIKGLMLLGIVGAVGYFLQAPGRSGSGGGNNGGAGSAPRRKGPTIRGVKDLPQAPRG